MIVWGFLFVVAALTGLAFWRWSGLGRDALPPVAAAITFALAGYVWQGAPALAGRPAKPSVVDLSVSEALIQTRKEYQLLEFGPEANWLMISDGLLRAGRTDQAVGALRAGLRKYPESGDLWMAMGAALLREGEGRMGEAAQYAFDRARMVSPDHPGPDFFTGIAKIEQGDLRGARAIWTELLARAPSDAPWRADLERRIAFLDQVLAQSRSAETPVAQ